MSYQDRFTRYGNPSRDADIKLTGWLVRPDYLDTAARIASCDKDAARLIADCQKLIEDLTEYRAALYRRYNELAVMPFTERLALQRCVGYDKTKTFFIRRVRVYEDGTKVETETERFEGKERRAAIARFNELLKQYPGIESEIDIAKKPWEK